MKKIYIIALSIVAIIGYVVFSTSDTKSSQIRIVGSSTVYPFTSTVAEIFGKKTSYNSPIVESTGTGGGFKLFCASAGIDTPDLTNASRKIKSKEIIMCNENGVTVTEFPVGIDGIVVANSSKSPKLSITIPELFLAMSKMVPSNNGLIPNPYTKWSDINPKFPNKKIEVLGPPPSSGTRDAMVDMIMKVGAKSFGIKDKKIYKVLREDGHFIESGENDNLIIKKLTSNKNLYGIFGYSYLAENKHLIQAATVNGIDATEETISNFTYPVSRNLYVYIKRENYKAKEDVKAFVAEYLSRDSMGKGGYLEDKGLISFPEVTYKTVYNDVTSLKTVNNK